jgi:inner membrane protein
MDILGLLFTPPSGLQAFWIWLSIGGVILAIEAMIGTQWLLWPATAAGLVAVLTLLGLPINGLTQLIIFALLTIILSFLSKRFLKVDLLPNDINDPHARLVGQEALVIESFDKTDGVLAQGRVIYEGIEWPAVFERKGQATEAILANEKVEILKVSHGKLWVKPA